MDEFCIYAGLGTNTARNIAETTGALFRVGAPCAGGQSEI